MSIFTSYSYRSHIILVWCFILSSILHMPNSRNSFDKIISCFYLHIVFFLYLFCPGLFLRYLYDVLFFLQSYLYVDHPLPYSFSCPFLYILAFYNYRLSFYFCKLVHPCVSFYLDEPQRNVLTFWFYQLTLCYLYLSSNFYFLKLATLHVFVLQLHPFHPCSFLLFVSLIFPSSFSFFWVLCQHFLHSGLRQS